MVGGMVEARIACGLITRRPPSSSTSRYRADPAGIRKMKYTIAARARAGAP